MKTTLQAWSVKTKKSYPLPYGAEYTVSDKGTYLLLTNKC